MQRWAASRRTSERGCDEDSEGVQGFRDELVVGPFASLLADQDADADENFQVVGDGRLGETDRLVVLLTRDRGKKRGVARGGARSRKRFGGALEPFTHVRVAYQEREQRDLVRLDYADVLGSPLTAGGEACTYASYFAELLDEWAQDSDADDRLYRLGASMLDALTAGVPIDPLARYFEYWLLRLQGVYPEVRSTLSADAVGLAFSHASSVASAPGSPNREARTSLSTVDALAGRGA